MPDTFDQLAQPDEARDAFRRARAIEAMRDALDAELDRDAARALHDLDHGQPNRVAAVLEAAIPAAEQARGTAGALRDLAALADADFPWGDWARASTPDRPPADGRPTYRDQLGQWEELAVQRQDVAEHADAYGADPAVAKFDHAAAEARIAALRQLIARLDKLASRAGAGEDAAGA